MMDTHARDEAICGPIFGVELVTWNRVRIVACCCLVVVWVLAITAWDALCGAVRAYATSARSS